MGAKALRDTRVDAPGGAQLGDGQVNIGIGGQARLDRAGGVVDGEASLEHEAHIARGRGRHQRQFLHLRTTGLEGEGAVTAENLQLREGGLGQLGQIARLGKALVIQRNALTRGALDRRQAEPALQMFAIEAAAGEQGQQEMGVMTLAIETVEMDRGKGEIDPLQCRIQQLNLIGPEPETSCAIEPQVQFRYTAHQIVERCGIGFGRAGFGDRLAHAPGQMPVARQIIDGGCACGAVEEDRAALETINRVPVDSGFEIGATQGLFSQHTPAGSALGRKIPGEIADSVGHGNPVAVGQGQAIILLGRRKGARGPRVKSGPCAWTANSSVP